MATKAIHSNYWLDEDIFADDDILDDEDAVENSKTRQGIRRIIRLAAVRRSIGNFVSILSGKNVPVQFSSGDDSYTDGEHVVIAADDNPKNFDIMVGLALHEASHILLTDFNLLKLMSRLFGNWGNGWGHSAIEDELKLFHPSVANVLEGEEIAEYRQHVANIKTLMNILEDRRIDQHVYTRARGYRPYYNSMYDKYFFSATVTKNLKYNPEWRELTIENYINRLLLAFHPDADLDALPGLRALVGAMDLANIDRVASRGDDEPYRVMMERVKADDDDNAYSADHWIRLAAENILTTPSFTFEDMPTLWQEANKLYGYILKFVSLAKEQEQNDEDSDEREGQSANNGEASSDDQAGNEQSESRDANGASGATGSDLPDLDGAPQTPSDMKETEVETTPRGKQGTFNESAGRKAIDKMYDIMNNDLKKKKIKVNEKQSVDALDSANADIVDVSDSDVPSAEVLVIRKINEAVVDADWFPFQANGWQRGASEEAISAGRRMGAILANRLQLRTDPLYTKQSRLRQGKIDRRLLANLGMDIESVFQKTTVDNFKPAMLHLTLDASSSMQGQRWDRAVTVATAIAVVASKVANIDAVISIRGGSDTAMVGVLFDSRRDSLAHYMKYIRMIRPYGLTPEGLCFKATMNLILEAKNTHEVYFINFSDGEPGFYCKNEDRRSSWTYEGTTALRHTKKLVNQMRNAGVKVLSYFISDDGWGYSTFEIFKEMYGEDSVDVDMYSYAEVLRTLNKLLMKR